MATQTVTPFKLMTRIEVVQLILGLTPNMTVVFRFSGFTNPQEVVRLRQMADDSLISIDSATAAKIARTIEADRWGNGEDERTFKFVTLPAFQINTFNNLTRERVDHIHIE